MNEEIAKLFLNYGVLGILGVIFLKYITKVLNEREQQLNEHNEEFKSYMKESLETLTLLKYRIANDYVSKEVMQLMAKLRVRYIMSDYKYIVVRYIVRNNIKQNIKLIESEIENYVSNVIFRTLEIFKNKMRLDDIQIINNTIQRELLEYNQTILLPIFDELAEREHTKEETDILIRELENHFERITDKLVKEMDNLD